MTNQESIAAILAADTPLKAARYAVDNPPAQEIEALLDEAVADHDEIERLRAELEEAREREYAAGADMVALVNAAAAYLAVMTWSPAKDPNWEPRHLIPDYKTPEKRLAKLLKGPARPSVELLKDLIEPAKTINDLRARLDTANSHIGALISDSADEDTQNAARAWLRRA